MTNLALLVGINKYEGGNNLLGCCNDVDNIYSLLVDTFKTYKPSDIVVLKDEQATRRNILMNLREMRDKCLTDNTPRSCFFSDSGHGSQVADFNGDEADGKDEIICPHDMNWSKGIYITDDELSDIFSGFPQGIWLEVVLDCCHSGTATRSSDKTLPSPYAGLKLPVKRMRSSVRHVKNHVLWSGCGDDQTSADAYLGGKFNGAFTYYWTKAIRRDPKRSRAEILSETRKNLKASSYTQVPRLTVP